MAGGMVGEAILGRPLHVPNLSRKVSGCGRSRVMRAEDRRIRRDTGQTFRDIVARGVVETHTVINRRKNGPLSRAGSSQVSTNNQQLIVTTKAGEIDVGLTAVNRLVINAGRRLSRADERPRCAAGGDDGFDLVVNRVLRRNLAGPVPARAISDVRNRDGSGEGRPG